MFLNCSNHSSVNWSTEQKNAAENWGEIVDFPFPMVDANMDEKQVAELAEKTAAEILKLNPEAVMCQGEFTLTYALVERIKMQGIPVLAACSERRTIEEKLPNGETQKVSVFAFARFRRY